MKFDIHFCLISAQAAPNLLPILDQEFKPKEAVFLVTESMKEQANALQKAFEQKNVKVSQKLIKNEFNYPELDQQLTDIFDQYSEQNIALNVTGGTKLMSIATATLFNYMEKPIFYIETDSNKITFLSKQDEKWLDDIRLNTEIDLNIYLLAYGNKIIEKQESHYNQKIIEAMEITLKNYSSYNNIIPVLNRAASLSANLGYKYQLERGEIKFKKFSEFLKTLEQENIIDINDKIINFRNKETREMLNGGWLELYTYQQVKNIKKVDDVLCNTEIVNNKYNEKKSQYDKQNLGNVNELDVIFLAKNKLHIIECKTQKMDVKDAKPDDILYKLEALKDYGGLKTKKCLVSYFEVPEKVKNRAKSLNIEIIQGSDIFRLKQLIEHWIAK